MRKDRKRAAGKEVRGPHSPETCAAISAAKKGVPWSAALRAAHEANFKVRKDCKRCGVSLTRENGYVKHNGAFRATCKKCHARHHAEWRRDNTERSHENDCNWRANNRARCRQYQINANRKFYTYINKLKASPCLDCGCCFPPECMDFDHVRGVKKFALSKTPTRKWADILAEICKCDVICSNCHRIRTKRNWVKDHSKQTPLK